MKQQQWKFGEGQTSREEREEIRGAQRAGLGEAYSRAQRWHLMRQEELEHRRSRQRERQHARARAIKGARS